MLYLFILLQFTAHLLADFVFQPHSWSQKKSRKVFSKYHLYHGFVVFLFSYILSFDYSFWKAAILLAVVHFFTDCLKSYFQLRSRIMNYFFIDQFIHIAVLIIISTLYYNFRGVNFIFEMPAKVVVTIAGFILCAKPTNIFIKNIFIAFSVEIPSNIPPVEGSEELHSSEKSLPNAGKLIGIMERFLVLSLILVGQFSAVGLIIAAKSILRFKSTQKNEYILVGTLLSFGIAVMLGIFISKMYIV